MHFVSAILFVLATVDVALAIVKLHKGVNQTVTFEGEEVAIHVDATRGTNIGTVIICFGSTPDAKTTSCPKGYAAYPTAISSDTKKQVYKVDRQGRVTKNSYPQDVAGTIKFNEDGSLNILVHELPDDATTVVLPHAEKWAPKKSSESKKGKESKSNTGTYMGIGFGVGIILILGAIGALVCYCIMRKKKQSKNVPLAMPQDELMEIRDETPDVLTVPMSPAVVEPPLAVPNSPATPESKVDCNAPAVVSTPQVNDPLEIGSKTVSKVARVPLIAEKTPLTVTAKAAPEAPKSPTKALTPTSPAKATTPNAPAKRTASPTLKTEASLPLDKTQDSRTRRSPPTTDFGTDTVAENLAEHSEYNVRGYVRRSEAHITGSPRKRSRSRPLVVDEVVETRFEVEHHLVYAERMEILRDHDHYMIMEHVSSQVNHKVSDAERALLKAAPADAPRLADAVVAEADEVIGRFVKGRPLTWDEDDELWDIVNEESTPASLGYVIMYRRVPYIFKPKKASMADPMVRTMPLMGLYILLLDKEYPTTFRVKLAKELRARGSRIFPRMQKDQLKYAAFPATYMILAYNKNPAQFLAGEEIHSQASKKKQK